MISLKTFHRHDAAARKHSEYHLRIARKLCVACGCGGYFNVLSNALLSAQDGQPWQEVDYVKARLAIKHEKASSEPGNRFEAWYSLHAHEIAFGE